MRLRSLQIVILALLIVVWYVLTKPGLVPPFYFEQDNRAAFFFGEPQKVFKAIIDWFVSGEIFVHLGVTLLETALGFVIGSVSKSSGRACGCGPGFRWFSSRRCSSCCSPTAGRRGDQLAPRGRRLAAVIEAGETFKARFKAQGTVRAARSVDLVVFARVVDAVQAPI